MPIRRPVTQYPIPLASKKIEIVDLLGLTTYTPGGETLDASLFDGLGFEAIIPMNVGVVAMPTTAPAVCPVPVALSFSGTYFITVTAPATMRPGESSRTAVITWYVTATGAEAGAIDLSAETVRVLMFLG